MLNENRQLEIYHLLRKLSEESRCIDKQVACVITDHSGNVVSYGVNKVHECNKNCHDKENRICVVTHAEVDACEHIPHIYKDRKNLVAHVTLFPCKPCQNTVSAYCDTIVSYTEDHKGQIFDNIVFLKDLGFELIIKNGIHRQLSIAQGEFAELITAISDYFYRRHDKNVPIEKLLDEILDAELMLNQVKRIAWLQDGETFNKLREMRSVKYSRLLKKVENDEL